MMSTQKKAKGAGSPTMELSHEIEIAAPPERVWAVLTDFAAYGEWNPYQTIEGELKVFGKVHVTSRKLRSDEVTQRTRAVLITVSPASDWVSGRMTGMAPATAASK